MEDVYGLIAVLSGFAVAVSLIGSLMSYTDNKGRNTVLGIFLAIIFIGISIYCFNASSTAGTHRQSKNCAQSVRITALVTEVTCVGGHNQDGRCRYALKVNDKEFFYYSSILWTKGERINLCIDKEMTGNMMFPSWRCDEHLTHNPTR